jgi:hypothetical protein
MPDVVLDMVEARLRSALGEPDARAAVTFVGAGRIEVLRFSAEGLVRYGTLGMAGEPMGDPVRGPRAELLLTLRAGRADTSGVLRALAVAAASPQVEGLVLAPGSTVDLASPLWPGAPFTALLAAPPTPLLPDLPLPPPSLPVTFLPVLPLTPQEAAFKRTHGPEALHLRWAEQKVDVTDPLRP